tara:strand:- start:50094 stop:51764 length:1671 start_codon:yes stop_codon:yes gene_type:complete
MKSQLDNGASHRYSDSKYGHFSPITAGNKHLFPDLIKANPQKFILEKGDCLYIPSNWWHWITSHGERSIGVNAWFSYSREDGLPKKYNNIASEWPALTKWTNEYLISICDKSNPGGIWIWSEKSAIKKRITLKEFIDRHGDSILEKEFAYLLTAPEYELAGHPQNKFFIEALSSDVFIPDCLDVDGLGDAKWNFWMNFGGIDSGMHYDNDDGYLFVVDGRKEIILYPPSDSKYLSPYPLIPTQLQQTKRHFMFNLYRDLGPISTSPVGDDYIDTADLLAISLLRAPNLAKFTLELQKKYGPGKIVYGVKNCDGVFRWEYYFYGVNKEASNGQHSKDFFATSSNNSQFALPSNYASNNPEPVSEANVQGEATPLMIYSYDYTEDMFFNYRPENGTEQIIYDNINLYYPLEDYIEMPFTFKEITHSIPDDKELFKSVACLMIYDNLFTTKANIHYHCKNLGIDKSDADNLIKFFEGSNYKCLVINLVNKKSEIGLYCFGISYEAFLNFLTEYLYTHNLVVAVTNFSEESKKMEFEVGFHFPKGDTSGRPSRTAFYGLF